MNMFLSDNVTAMHPNILKALIDENGRSGKPYGNDECTKELNEQMTALFGRETFVIPCVTGTMANCLSLSLKCSSINSMIVQENSHILLDESTAPELFTGGARVVGTSGPNGKLDERQMLPHLIAKGDVHAVQPSAISICQTTELGTVYSVDELKKLKSFADEHNLAVHMDGARFANAVSQADCSPNDFVSAAGAFALSFGATKNGCMGAEAVVLFDVSLAEQAWFRMKRAGHLISKMRFISAQLTAYIANDLWIENASHANASASYLVSKFHEVGIETVPFGGTNIVFAYLSKAQAEALKEKDLNGYELPNGTMRFCCSWQTTQESVDKLVDIVTAT